MPKINEYLQYPNEEDLPTRWVLCRDCAAQWEGEGRLVYEQPADDGDECEECGAEEGDD